MPGSIRVRSGLSPAGRRTATILRVLLAASPLLLTVAACAAGATPSSAATPADIATPTDIATSAPSEAWETVLQLGPVTDVVVTGGAFESVGRYRLVASCRAPGQLLITSDEGRFPFVCTADGSPRTQVIASGRVGRTVVEVDSGPLSEWRVDVQIPAP